MQNNLDDGVNKSISKLVNKAINERFPKGEPEPKLFSQGYRKALVDFYEFKKKDAVRKQLSKVFNNG